VSVVQPPKAAELFWRQYDLRNNLSLERPRLPPRHDIYCHHRGRKVFACSVTVPAPLTCRLTTALSSMQSGFRNDGEKKVYRARHFAEGAELALSMIDHRKVLVLAMNGPSVGASAAWFQGICDLFYAAGGAWLQVTFSELGLITENGSAIDWAMSLGAHRADELLILGGEVSVGELKQMGMVNQIFPKDGFHHAVHEYLLGVLDERDGDSMMVSKRLHNEGTRDRKIVALFDAWHAVSERFVNGEPLRRMNMKMEGLACQCAPFNLGEAKADSCPAKRSGRQSKM